MLVAVYEEVWLWPVWRDSQPKLRKAVGAGDGYDAARAIAQAKAREFDRSEYEGNARFEYWWGHDKDAPELHRFVIKAA